MAIQRIELDEGVSILSGAPPVHYSGPCTLEVDIDALPEWDALHKYIKAGTARVVDQPKGRGSRTPKAEADGSELAP